MAGGTLAGRWPGDNTGNPCDLRSDLSRPRRHVIEEGEFRAQAQHVLSACSRPDLRPRIAGTALMRLAGNAPPWQRSGLRVVGGQTYSVFANGRIQWSPHDAALYGGPRFHLWTRVVPGGRIANLCRDTDTFTADCDGEIELGIYMGIWRDAYGTLATSDDLYRRLQGHLDALVIVCRGEPDAALHDLIAVAPQAGFLRDEADRLMASVDPPRGWHYLLETGRSAIFSADAAGPEGHSSIRLHGHDDQGILCRAVDCALTPTTQLAWRWRVDEHPSRVAEDTVRTHDYISIAAEFDNGRDLTWIWSAGLAPEFHFHCPIKAWSARETHLVVRGRGAELGRWYDESRNVHADVVTAMGSPPTRIVRIWLIGVSSFQHTGMRAEFAGITLTDGDQPISVL